MEMTPKQPNADAQHAYNPPENPSQMADFSDQTHSSLTLAVASVTAPKRPASAGRLRRWVTADLGLNHQLVGPPRKARLRRARAPQLVGGSVHLLESLVALELLDARPLVLGGHPRNPPAARLRLLGEGKRALPV